MSDNVICRLCLLSCENFRDIYDDKEVYDVTIKYFEPKFLHLKKHLTVMCLQCWSHITDFHTFLESVMKAQWTNADDTASKKYETSECFDDPPSSRKNSYPPSTDVEGELQDGLCGDPPMYVSNLEESRIEAGYIMPPDEESSMHNWESTRIDNETENAKTNVDDSETCEDKNTSLTHNNISGIESPTRDENSERVSMSPGVTLSRWSRKSLNFGSDKLNSDYSLSQLKEESSNVQNQSMENISNEMSISPVEDCSHELNNKSKGEDIPLHKEEPVTTETMMDTKFEDMAITTIETSSKWSIRSVGTENTEISLGESKLGISNKSSLALSMEIPEDDSNMVDKQCIKTRESIEGTKTPLLTSSRWSKRIINSENKKSNIPVVKKITKAKSQIKGKSATKENKKIPRTTKKASKVNLATKEKLTKEERDELIALWCPTLECVVCHKGFPRYKLLLAHFHEQHSNEKFVLTCCNLRFDTRARFEEHIRVHLNPEAFKCKRCSETFKWKISLTRHKCRVR